MFNPLEVLQYTAAKVNIVIFVLVIDITIRICIFAMRKNVADRLREEAKHEARMEQIK